MRWVRLCLDGEDALDPQSLAPVVGWDPSMAASELQFMSDLKGHWLLPRHWSLVSSYKLPLPCSFLVWTPGFSCPPSSPWRTSGLSSQPPDVESLEQSCPIVRAIQSLIFNVLQCREPPWWMWQWAECRGSSYLDVSWASTHLWFCHRRQGGDKDLCVWPASTSDSLVLRMMHCGARGHTSFYVVSVSFPPGAALAAGFRKKRQITDKERTRSILPIPLTFHS